MNKTTYIILLNWNGWQDTVACLESVLRLDHSHLQIIVCDNASTDGSIEKIREWAAGQINIDLSKTPLKTNANSHARAPVKLIEYDRCTAEMGGNRASDSNIVLIQTGANLGFAGGNNVGIRYALARGDADFVWLLNNDTVVPSNSLSKLLEVAVQREHIGIVGSTLCYYGQPDRIQAQGGGSFNPWHAMSRHIGEGEKYRPLSTDEVARIEREMAYVVGASMLVSRAFLEEVGLMQEDYFLYFEEMDWAERGRRCHQPYQLAYASKSIVYHKVGAAAGTHSRSLFSLRYLTKNRLRFMKRFYPTMLGPARLRLLWECAKSVPKGRFQEAKLLMSVALSAVHV